MNEIIQYDWSKSDGLWVVEMELRTVSTRELFSEWSCSPSNRQNAISEYPDTAKYGQTARDSKQVSK